jgi:hypothetical protein
MCSIQLTVANSYQEVILSSLWQTVAHVYLAFIFVVASGHCGGRRGRAVTLAAPLQQQDVRVLRDVRAADRHRRVQGRRHCRGHHGVGGICNRNKIF